MAQLLSTCLNPNTIGCSLQHSGTHTKRIAFTHMSVCMCYFPIVGTENGILNLLLMKQIIVSVT